MHAGHRNPLELDFELKTVIGTSANYKIAVHKYRYQKLNTSGCLRLKYYVNAHTHNAAQSCKTTLQTVQSVVYSVVQSEEINNLRIQLLELLITVQ